MIEGVTKSGFHYSLEEDSLNDFEVVDAIADIVSGTPSRMILGLSTFMVKVLGTEGRAALYDHVRTDTGRVPTELIEQEITEILVAGNEAVKK